jgi:acyl-CoA synthetase (AMP-forming)/AMP-acid ligase II
MPIKSHRADLHHKEGNILDWLFPEGSTPSDRPLWIDASNNDNSLSPAQLIPWVKRVGYGLQKLGVGVGDSLLVFTPNHIFVPVAYLGTVSLGCAFSGASPAFTVMELVHQMKVVAPKVFLVHPSLLDVGLKAASEASIPKSSIYLFSDVALASTDGLYDWRQFMGSPFDTQNWRWPSFTPAESRQHVGTVNFSSGTTGLPKGVAVTHSNLIWNVEQIVNIYGYDSTERWLGFLPLYHAYGQTYAVLIATKQNIPIQIMKAFQFEEYLGLVQKHRITRLQTVPPIMVMLSKRPEVQKYDLSSVKEMLCGAAPLGRDLQNEVEKKLGIRVTQGWGLSETTCAVCGVPTESTPPQGSVGVLMSGSEVMLVDDDGKEVEEGERGELYVRGPQVAKGYWQNEEATQDTFGGGWLKTGDVGVINKEGFLWIVDRKKELIKVNGLQVSPAELEMALIEHPGIEDSAVVGINLSTGERPRAYIKLAENAQLTPEQVQEWIKPRVAKHKYLVGGVVIVPEIPKLMSGKIQRKVLREWSKRDLEAIEGNGTGDGKARL